MCARTSSANRPLHKNFGTKKKKKKSNLRMLFRSACNRIHINRPIAFSLSHTHILTRVYTHISNQYPFPHCCLANHPLDYLSGVRPRLETTLLLLPALLKPPCAPRSVCRALLFLPFSTLLLSALLYLSVYPVFLFF